VLPETFAAAPDKKLKSDLIRLFTTSYRESNAGRGAEYLQCLRNNLQHTLIHEVCVLDENCGWLPTHDKIRVRTVKSRPTYADFFQWINQLCTPQDISIIANSDIYFDETLSLLTRGLRPDTCAALSRWDVLPAGTCQLFDRNDSQDVWAFLGPVHGVTSDFLLGVPRCDNRILFELRAAGYQVINPAFTIRAQHLHAGVRTEYPAVPEGPFVPGPYAYLFPHNLMSLPQLLLCRLLRTDGGAAYRIDRRLLGRLRPDRILKRSLRKLLR